MNKNFYRNCIMEDRNSRKFLDFNEEQWFKEFMRLKDREVIESSAFSEGAIWRRNIRFFDEERKNSCLEMHWKSEFPKLDNIGEYRHKLTFSKEILDLLSSIDPYILAGFLYSYKSYYMGNLEEHNQKEFPRVNLPLIRMMDYFLEKCAFKQVACVIERLEEEYISLWLELTYEKINKTIKENINNPDLLYFLAVIPDEEFLKFFQKENVCIMENASFEAIYILLQNVELPEEYICHEFFLQSFKNFKLREQICITELLEKREYSHEFIKQLHKLFNKENESYFTYCTFEMTEERLKELILLIENSSYFAKNDIKNSILWKNIKTEENQDIDLSIDYYSEIMDLYHECRSYATSSIVNSLYPLNELSSKVTHIQNQHFNILARVRTMWEDKKLSDTFEIRTFCSFSILTEKNMSHYGDSVLYGYYTNVSEDLIAHIFPKDSLSEAGARYESELTKKNNMLLDIEDLNQFTLKLKTYNQLCIRTKTKDGKILWPDCIVCIDEIDERSQIVADELDLKIVVLHKNEDTIERNDDIYAHLQ